MTPLLCLLPGIIFDFVMRVTPDLDVPIALNGLFDGLNGLVGLFNSLLMLSDPALLAVWDDLRALVRRGTSKGSSEGASGPGIGRRRTSPIDDDVLASGFGVGARTRTDDAEEGAGMEEGTGVVEETRREGSDELNLPIPLVHSEDAGNLQEDATKRYPPRPDLRHWRSRLGRSDLEKDERNRDVREEQGRQARRGSEQGLEIHVRVDVTQEATMRMSRIDQMEDWLDGL